MNGRRWSSYWYTSRKCIFWRCNPSWFKTRVFLEELNNLNTYANDIGNSYLEADTKKVFITAGKEFVPLEGHLLITNKSLYGLRTSVPRWNDKFSDYLRDLDFKPSKEEPDIWMRLNKDYNIYEYVAVYVDYLAIAMKNCDQFIATLKENIVLSLRTRELSLTI